MKGVEQAQVSLADVCKSYKGKPVLQDLTLDIRANKFTAVIGPSGCGKTIIIDLIAGYEAPDRGSVTCRGTAVDGPRWDRLVVFQETALFPWKTTLENVAFGPISQGENSRDAEARARLIMEKFGLAGFEEKYPCQLSGGMQRRAELARATINTPDVMLF